ncbi:MAG: glycosyltransferase family 2 protein [Chloroflexi bacterium]|nr:glycosyltransferase family 2 protein [Chloroflexota bacterium]MBU1661920.1 glycosyltransferase family 2 protein [Chloroflexota bacterium]
MSNKNAINSTVLSVVIPAYNEEDGIADIVERVLAIEPALAEVGVAGLELIVVDDGSKDRTAEIVRSYPQVKLIQHASNQGYGAALKTGWCAARGDLLGFLDADGTYPPEHFPNLCQHALNGADLVVGSRRSGDTSGMPLMRKIGNLLWSNLITILGRQRVIDPASGMRVFKREILEQLYPLPDGLNLTPVMSTRAVHEGIKLVEVPIRYEERVGRSKLSVVRDGSLFLSSIIWTVLTYNPVRILGLIGLAGIALALIVALGLVVSRLSGVTDIGPWGIGALFAALVSGVGGINVFALGVTFNYLIALFSKRPVRQGLFGRPIFDPPLDRHFSWLGILGMLVGLGMGLLSLALGLNGWDIARLWLYLLGSAMFTLSGVQLVIYWILLRVLDELSQREILVQRDLGNV